MRKRLLMQFLVLVCAVGAYAANVGDYLYTANAKYRITGANLFVNGDFAQGLDATWTNETGGTVSGDVWGIETGKGPNGENVVVSKSGSSASETWLHFALPLQQAGTYTFSYWVKAESSVLTSIVATPASGENKANTGTNAVRFFTNATGDNTEDAVFSTATSFGTEWKQVVFTIEAGQDNYLVFNAAQIATGTMFTNFEVYPVEEVYDSRIAERLLAYMKSIYNEPDFTNGKETMTELITALENILTSGEEVTAEDMAGISTEVEAAIQEYLGANAGNLVSTTIDATSTTRYLDDWSKRTYINWNNISAWGNWTFTGGRWGCAPNVVEGTTNDDGTLLTYLERPQEDGYVFTAGIQTGYTLSDQAVVINPSTFANSSIKAGKYMFSIEAQGTAAANKAAPYGSNPGVEIAGPWMWIGTDTIAFRPHEAADDADHPTWKFKDETTVLNDNNWQRLYIIGEIKEGEDVTAGFHFPVVTNTGGRYSLRNPEFRYIGHNQEEVDHFYAHDQLFTQQTALTARLDSAKLKNQLTLAENMPWGHAILNDSISKFEKKFNEELLTVVDANGNELQPDKVTLEFKDEVLSWVKYMNSAINNYYSANYAYQTLKNDVAACEEAIKVKADATFQAAIDKAKALVNGVTDDPQVDEFNAADSELLLAREDYGTTTATRSNPTQLVIENGDLKGWGGLNIAADNTIYHSVVKTTRDEDATENGWDIKIGIDGKQWDIQGNDNYETGMTAGIWRGTSVGPNGKFSATRTIRKPGVYEFRAKAQSSESGDGAHWNEYTAIAKYASIIDEETFDMVPVDTLYNPNVRLFFGPDGNLNDSITLTKCAPERGSYYRNTPLVYSIIYVKSDNTEEKVEFGLHAYENGATAGANTFGFGDVKIYYVGAEADYKTALKADYDTEVTKARSLIAKYPEFGWLTNKFYKYFGEKIPDADYDALPTKTNPIYWMKSPAEMSIQEMQNAYLSIVELEQMLESLANPVETAIDAVGITEKAQTVSTGVYTITGVKVGTTLDGLQKGIYIVNGKKVLVK